MARTYERSVHDAQDRAPAPRVARPAPALSSLAGNQAVAWAVERLRQEPVHLQRVQHDWMLPGYEGPLPVGVTDEERRRRLPICSVLPPLNHQLADCHVLESDATCRMDLPIKYMNSTRVWDARWSSLLVQYSYSVGTFVPVHCLWPRAWPAPGPNRFGILPKAEFAVNPGANDPRPSYGAIHFSYRLMDGTMYTPPAPFGPHP